MIHEANYLYTVLARAPVDLGSSAPSHQITLPDSLL